MISSEKHDRCLFIITDKYSKALTDHMKALKGVYNGAGWYVEWQHEESIRKLCSEAAVNFIEFPLSGETFDELRKRHKSDFLREELAKIRSKLASLKSELGLSGLNDDQLNSTDHKINLLAYPQGKQLLEFINTKEKLEKAIGHIEEEEKIAALKLDPSSQFQRLLLPTSEDEIAKELKQTALGIKTGFKINGLDLEIPGGAITILAAPTGHGKTTVAINLALGTLAHPDNQDKCIYFFSYEESRAAITTLFLNTYINEEISKNNRESIRSYFREGSLDYVSALYRKEFIRKKDEFFTQLIEKGRLNILYEDMSTESLVEAIRFLKKNKTNVGLVCIDYMQLLKTNNCKLGSRQEGLKEICLILKECAVETGVPFLIGAQFNRSVVSEADIWATNIGEAGDIERIAHTIIGFWNRNFKGNKEGNKTKSNSTAPTESALYFEILKSRSIGAGHHTVLDFDGNTGTIRNRNDEMNKRIIPLERSTA